MQGDVKLQELKQIQNKLKTVKRKGSQCVFVCVSVNAGEKLQHLPEPHQPAEGHPAPQRGPRGQAEPGLQHTVRRQGRSMHAAKTHFQVREYIK